MILSAGDHIPSPFSRKSRYILIVEGNTNDLFLTAMLLHRFNYPVCTARNATQALDMISVAVPALIVTDHAPPRISGIELMRTLSSNTRTSGIPVILLIPKNDPGSSIQDVEIGGSSCLQKPVDVEDLYRAVQTAIELTPRSNIRVQTMLPVVVNKVPLDTGRGECATHLSAQGIYIRTFKYHSRGEQLSLQLTIDGRTIRADGRILYTRRFEEGPFMEPGVAVQFTKMTAEDRDQIRKFIHNEVTKGIVVERS